MRNFLYICVVNFCMTENPPVSSGPAKFRPIYLEVRRLTVKSDIQSVGTYFTDRNPKLHISFRKPIPNERLFGMYTKHYKIDTTTF